VKKKILITGSNGLLGQKLVKQLVNSDEFEFLATSSGTNRIEKFKNIPYQSLDITNQEEINAVFESYKPDIVINTEAMTNVDTCEGDRENCWDLNVNAVKYLFEASKKVKAHFIHLSTDFIFDGENGPYKEDDTPNPLSYYGESKWAAEKILINSDNKN